jgi:hypothetical protein
MSMAINSGIKGVFLMLTHLALASCIHGILEINKTFEVRGL